MVRPLRVEFAGAIYHVMSRGNQRQAIVLDDADRRRRLDWLRRTVQRHGWRLHAFVLMTNHEHLFLETPEPNLSAGMQYLNGSYTGYFNRRHGRVGHLFQGRFRGHLIEEQGGAPWIRNQIEFHGLVDAIGLDFYPLRENLQKSRRIVFGEESAQGKAWLDGFSVRVARAPAACRREDAQTIRRALGGSRPAACGSRDRSCP
jgi:REP element-mobilizing transposase RayT